MPTVVSDTGPLRYLIVVNSIEVLPQLFGGLTIPSQVQIGLLHPSAPLDVRAWAGTTPGWLRVQETCGGDRQGLQRLDFGERHVVGLALDIQADLVLMDDRDGVVAARSHGLNVIGTIGVLDLAADKHLIDIEVVAASLRATNFRHPPGLLASVVRRHGKGPG